MVDHHPHHRNGAHHVYVGEPVGSDHWLDPTHPRNSGGFGGGVRLRAGNHGLLSLIAPGHARNGGTAPEGCQTATPTCGSEGQVDELGAARRDPFTG